VDGGMSFTFRDAVRENVWLLLGFAGGTGSGKTYSALRVASGVANGHTFVGIDTENGRMSYYADDFTFRVGEIFAPFRPEKYEQAIHAAVEHLASLGVPEQNRVVVVDSMSHEWYGDGGCLDWHDELMGTDMSKNLSAWIKPKRAHKQMVTALLQVRAHVVLCFRAEEKVESVKDEKTNRQVIVKKKSLSGLDGWIPIAEKNLPYEMTVSCLLMADRPGLPLPIKLPEQLRPMVPLDRPLDEHVGRRLAEWAAGAKPAARPAVTDMQAPDTITSQQTQELIDMVTAMQLDARVAGQIVKRVAGVGKFAQIPESLFAEVCDALSIASRDAA
jgi:hypothetical protein